jgi:hypothetical protein
MGDSAIWGFSFQGTTAATPLSRAAGCVARFKVLLSAFRPTVFNGIHPIADAGELKFAAAR